MRVSYADWSRTATRMLKTEPGRRFSTPHPTCLVSDERETGSRVAGGPSIEQPHRSATGCPYRSRLAASHGRPESRHFTRALHNDRGCPAAELAGSGSCEQARHCPRRADRVSVGRRPPWGDLCRDWAVGHPHRQLCRPALHPSWHAHLRASAKTPGMGGLGEDAGQHAGGDA